MQTPTITPEPANSFEPFSDPVMPVEPSAPIAPVTPVAPTAPVAPAVPAKHSPLKTIIIAFVLLVLGGIAGIFIARSLDTTSNMGLTPTPTQTPSVTVTDNVTATLTVSASAVPSTVVPTTTTPATPTPPADPYTGWKTVTLSDFALTMKVPANYTTKFIKNTWHAGDQNDFSSDKTYNDITVSNGSRVVLASEIRTIDASPRQCDLAGQDGIPASTKHCTTIYTTKTAANTYTLSADPNKNPAWQRLESNLTAGASSPIKSALDNLGGGGNVGSYFYMNNYSAQGGVLFNSFTQEEFNNVVLMLDSVKGY